MKLKRLSHIILTQNLSNDNGNNTKEWSITLESFIYAINNVFHVKGSPFGRGRKQCLT